MTTEYLKRRVLLSSVISIACGVGYGPAPQQAHRLSYDDTLRHFRVQYDATASFKADENLNSDDLSDDVAKSVSLMRPAPKYVFGHPKDNSLTDRGARALAKLDSIEILSVPNCQMADEGLLQLSRLPKLRLLVLGETPVSSAALKEFQLKRPGCAVRAFSAGIFYICHIEDATGITDEGLQHLYGCPKLLWAEFHNSELSEDALPQLEESLPRCLVTCTAD